MISYRPFLKHDYPPLNQAYKYERWGKNRREVGGRGVLELARKARLGREARDRRLGEKANTIMNSINVKKRSAGSAAAW